MRPNSLFLLAITAGILHAQEPPKSAPLLRLTIAVETRRLNPDAPMPMRFTIENTSDREVELDEPADYADGLELRDGGGRVVKTIGAAPGKRRPVKLDPGAFLGRTVDIRGALAGKEFKEGRFKMFWKLGDASSNVIEPIVVKDWVGSIETNFGTVKVEFYPDAAPNHVLNFIKLAQEKYYDGQKFYRVVPGFVIQAGRNRQMRTSPTLNLEPSERRHDFGTLSMAHSSRDVNSATSEFFICLGRVPSLDRQYSIFGAVVEGEQVVRDIGSVKTDHSPCPKCGKDLDARYVEGCCTTHHEDAPEVDVLIKKIVISEKKK